jgi:hypothetical protein
MPDAVDETIRALHRIAESGTIRPFSPDALRSLAARLAQSVPDPEDAYRSDEEDGRVAQLAASREEIAALREMVSTREAIFTERIDHMQQELHTLRADRAKLYEAAAGLDEAERERSRLAGENGELKSINFAITEEIARMRKTNSALTQQLFSLSAARGETTLFTAPGSPSSLDSEVLDILSGRREEDADGLLRLIARMHKRREDEKIDHEVRIEGLIRRLNQLERGSPPAISRPPPPQTEGISSKLTSTFSSFFQ